ncbi:nucleoside diphosphate kinase regulator [Shewanella algidipiscicola]|uniref:nucleoside diphosphate kinase regulator n=1 Tax=Shewanella algidipiscicola TaxID=614070 RepID=UPI000D785604|nr:nucleoside diphosphate kinase regulator [Shewanella algidipiscicola]
MSKKPNITVSSIDLARLEKMIDSLDGQHIAEIDDLMTELERAKILPPEQMPANIVTMNSTVRFKVASSDKEFSLTLVYPQNHNGDVGQISILAPVGSALLGLKEGDEIEWPKPGGGQLLVKIIAVEYQPERAGEYHL